MHARKLCLLWTCGAAHNLGKQLHMCGAHHRVEAVRAGRIVQVSAGCAPQLQRLFQDGGAVLQARLFRQQLTQAALKLLHLPCQLCELGLLPLPETPLRLQDVRCTLLSDIADLFACLTWLRRPPSEGCLTGIATC